MSLSQWIITFSISIVIIAIFKLVPILVKIALKKKNLTPEDKKAVEEIITKTIKELLKLTIIKTKDELEFYCVNAVMKELNEKGITAFTKQEIEIMVKMAINTIDNSKLIEEKFNKK